MTRFPEGKRFAFTILDDTDVATVANITPIYRLLEDLGMRTTKTVWPLPSPVNVSNFESSQTLADREYREFVVDLQRRGFEIASHGATMESSPRDQTLRGMEIMRETFGAYPTVHANHAGNRENLYWGAARIDHPIARAVYRRLIPDPNAYQGHVEGSPYWWGDIARERIQYVRNLTYDTLEVARINPTMPYRDPSRPLVNWWFSAADANTCGDFNRLLRPAEQERLERSGGAVIVATHFGKGFVRDGRLNPETDRLLRSLSRRQGWFVPVGTLLDHLRERGDDGTLPPDEWRRMQWRWLAHLLKRGVIARVRYEFETRIHPSGRRREGRT